MANLTVETLATVVSILFILGGLVSILFPVAPSVPTVWFGIFLYGISRGFTTVDQTFMAIITGIAAGTIALDYMLSRFGVQKLKAGPWGILGAILGFVIGYAVNANVIMTYLIAPVLGAIIFETLRGRDQVFSFKQGNYTVVAFMGGTVIKLVAALAMIGLFILRIQGKL